MKIKLKKLNKNAKLPTKGSEHAGGWDVYASEIIQESEDFVICKLGFSLEPPVGYKITLVPRSSITGTRWILQNSPGLGDSDYRGEYQYRFRAIPVINNYGSYIMLQFPSYDEFPYKIGDRIGQIYLEEVIPIEFEEVEELKETVRGVGGYGSTGVK